MQISFRRASPMTSDTFAEFCKEMTTSPMSQISAVVRFVCREGRPMRKHPVRAAAGLLRRSRKQSAICFVNPDELGEVLDAEMREGRCPVFIEIEHGEPAVFRIQFDADLVQPVRIHAEHSGDPADGEDLSYRSHCQAA